MLLIQPRGREAIPEAGRVTQHQPIWPFVPRPKQPPTFSESINNEDTRGRRLTGQLLRNSLRSANMTGTKRQCEYKYLHLNHECRTMNCETQGRCSVQRSSFLMALSPPAISSI